MEMEHEYLRTSVESLSRGTQIVLRRSRSLNVDYLLPKQASRPSKAFLLMTQGSLYALSCSSVPWLGLNVPGDDRWLSQWRGFLRDLVDFLAQF
jgi:hypothetical protein